VASVSLLLRQLQDRVMVPTDRDSASQTLADQGLEAVTKDIPEFLKLHVEDAPQTAPSRPETGRELAPLCRAFQEVTGWTLRLERRAADGEGAEDDPRGDSSCDYAFRLEPSPDETHPLPIELYKARSLAASVAALVSTLEETRDAVWHREADLAAGVPVTSRAREEEHLAQRLEAVLKGGAQAVGCQAAALYLLDEATTELKLRACWGLPRQRLLAPPRPLRGAMADLEALVGHAVVLEDTRILPQWKSPEAYPSAICVPVASPTEPLGTLWMFCERPRDFTPEQTNLVEIIAGRVASELQREVLLRECVQTKRADRQLLRVVEWQNDRLPSITPLLDDWELAGWTEAGEVPRGGFYDWYVPPDGSLAVAVGCAEGTTMEAALTCAALHGALRAHSAYRHNAAQMVNRVNETVWNSSAGGQLGALFYALIAPEKGSVEYCSAGAVAALVAAKDGFRFVSQGRAPLGSQPGDIHKSRRLRLARGDALVLLADPVLAEDGDSSLQADRDELTAALQTYRDATAEDLAQRVGAWLGQHRTGRNAALVVRRK
jgi:hypothetical protein